MALGNVAADLVVVGIVPGAQWYEAILATHISCTSLRLCITV
eukprot:COSAG02_NODE_2754_length_8090_cov_5.459016_9_plen_42_part_00